MGDHHKRDEWRQDIKARQRNVVFPDTVQNEARFWRNIGKQPFTTSTKVGLAVLAILGLGVIRRHLGRDLPGGGHMEVRLGNAPVLGTDLRSYRLGYSSQSPQYSERSTRS